MLAALIICDGALSGLISHVVDIHLGVLYAVEKNRDRRIRTPEVLLELAEAPVFNFLLPLIFVTQLDIIGCDIEKEFVEIFFLNVR